MTIQRAVAVGWDAADRRMRSAGRTSWNRSDYDEACRVTNRLLDEKEHTEELARASFRLPAAS